MHIHILGICGSFMGGIALLAREKGYHVTGSDANVYPPMSTQLSDHGIILSEGYDAEQFKTVPDYVVIGNALSRGNPAIEYVLQHRLPYTSGPQWLAEHVLKDRWVLAVAGTHGKTTTASMLAWILESHGMAPGFLIGGVPQNFGVSARLGNEKWFVVEADEYDTAFFDKRSKFVHYGPMTLILNNLEFDHADIFPNLEAIITQFHYLIRTVPSNGLIIAPDNDNNIKAVLSKGCWTPLEHILGNPEAHNMDDGGWTTNHDVGDGSRFDVIYQGEPKGTVNWLLLGRHNMDNALAAIAAAHHVGVPVKQATDTLTKFHSVKRRMELRGEVEGIRIYDDFAHHPTAIRMTLEGLRRHVRHARIFVVLELRSNTMRMGVHAQMLPSAFAQADYVYVLQSSQCCWDIAASIKDISAIGRVFISVKEIIEELLSELNAGDQVLIMSNGEFENIHERLLSALETRSGIVMGCGEVVEKP